MNSLCVKSVTRFLLILTILFLVAPNAAHAQLNSNTGVVLVSATLLESLTVTVSPASVALNLAPGGVSAASSPIAITTKWILGANRSQVNVYGSFSSPASALTDGLGDNIPSANILGLVTTGLPVTATPFSQSNPFGGSASLKLVNQGIITTNLANTRTDNLVLSIDMSTGPILPPGSYQGTLTIQAQAL